MGARPKLTQKRRTQILEAAAEMIGQRGLCDTRIADVAARAGLSPALIVYYFGSKEKLLTEALAYAEDLFYIEAFRELTGIEGASERLVRLMELSCPPANARDRRVLDAVGRAVVAGVAQRGGRPQARGARPSVAQHHRRGGQGRASGPGEFGPCDPDRFATYLSALMDGLALQVLMRDSAVDSGLVDQMCLNAAARQLGFDPETVREKKGSGQRSSRPRGRDGLGGRGGTVKMVFHPRERPWRQEISRREALKLMAGTAVAGGLLAGCGSGGSVFVGLAARDRDPGEPRRAAAVRRHPAVESGLEPEEGPLRVYNWADYINPAVLKGFTEEFGAEVEVTTFYNSQEAVQKLWTGKFSFDVFFPTQDELPKYVAGKLLQPLNHDYLPNLEKNVWPTLADPFYDRSRATPRPT